MLQDKVKLLLEDRKQKNINNNKIIPQNQAEMLSTLKKQNEQMFLQNTVLEQQLLEPQAAA